MTAGSGTVVALTGGVGGAKLGLGLAHLLAPEELAFVVNTADDFEHLGLHVSPDVDTLLYTLSGEANPETGWGRRGESWNFMGALAELGGKTWFNLGDRDLATHVLRSHRLARGERFTEVVGALARSLGVRHPVLPMSDDPVRTLIDTDQGELAFQHYFVRERCAPAVRGFRFAGAEAARPSPEVLAALADPNLRGVVICPSNPFVSIDPILAVGELRQALDRVRAPVVAVSPLVGGDAIKGPTAKMMDELGVPRTVHAVAAHYRGLIDGLVMDQRDAVSAAEVSADGPATVVAQTVMVTLQERVDLARTTLAFVDSLAGASRR